MAKQNIHTTLYKILAYASSCLNEGIEPDIEEMRKLANANERMFVTALQQAADHNFLDGVIIRNYLDSDTPHLLSRHISITLEGEEYLADNSKMKEVAAMLGNQFYPILVNAVSATIIKASGLQQMRRDMDIVRQLLMLGADGGIHGINAYTIDTDYSRELIVYHVRIMTEAGLIESYIKPDKATVPQTCLILSLTWQGNDLLDAIESETVWRELKQRLAQTVGTVSLDVLKSLAISIATKQIGL